MISYMNQRHQTVFYFILFFCQMADVETTGTLELTMNYFQNPTEHLGDGSCCDALCIGQCDNIFHFSLDQSSGRAGDVRSYFYWTKITGTYQDQNNVYFKDDMNGVNNPILWTFNSWPGSVLFKVYIEDDDSPFSANDYLDGMVQNLTLTPAKLKSQSTSTVVTVYGRRGRDKTVLVLSYKLYCDDNFYGPSCSVLCVPRDHDSSGHYNCDPDTGKKICKTGWEDVSNDCLTFADDCLGKDCHHGRCVDGIRSYSCSCMEGFTGTLCEVNVNECKSNPCRNRGTCSDLVDGYTCACPSGFVGPQCEHTFCSLVAQNPCLNGGTCYGSQQCLCRPGYVGNKCEMRTCDAVPCVNGGSCSENSTCLCPPEYTGNQCEVLKCDIVSGHCQKNGSCAEGKCVCQKPYYGVNCEMEGCTNNTCQNGGTCIKTDEGTGYKCTCTPSYTGQNCQSPENSCALLPNRLTDKGGEADVNIFVGDSGILLVILIVLCIILFIIVIVLTAVMYRRRRMDRLNEKRLVTASVSTILAPSGNHRVENDYFKSALDGDFHESCESADKSCKKDFEYDNQAAENDYEKLDGVDQVEITVGQGQEPPEPPERFVYKVKDSDGQPIRLENFASSC